MFDAYYLWPVILVQRGMHVSFMKIEFQPPILEDGGLSNGFSLLKSGI